MVKETIRYTDYFGEERTEDFYFNLTKAELVEMEMSLGGSMEFYITRISQTQDKKELWQLFKNIVLKAYGEKSQDGRRFMKGDEIARGFEECPAYDELIMRMLGDAEYAAKFLNSLMPADLVEEAQKQNRQTVAPMM